MEDSELFLDFFSKTILDNRPIMIFVRNNKKLMGYVRAFDRHLNLVMDNVKELWTSKNCKKKVEFHERVFPKLIIRGDSIILVLRM